MVIKKSLNINKYISRKRKMHMDCTRTQKWKNKEIINSKLSDIKQFCSGMGLQIDEIILSPIDNESPTNETKITIVETPISKDFQIFECLKAKDKTNMSVKKYTLLKSTLKEVKSIRLPGIELVDKLKHELDNFFAIKSNNDGFYIDPVKKIKFVCEKFINKNPNFSKNKFKIKISADSTSISRTNIHLLNVS